MTLAGGDGPRSAPASRVPPRPNIAHARLSPLRRLADTLGIVPKYLDQTGTEWRETTDHTRVALLAAMRIDASTEAAAEAALRALHAEQRRDLVAPVRVVVRDDTEALSRISVRLPRAVGGSARWSIELEREDGEATAEEGAWPGGARQALPLPAAGRLPLGYHRVRVKIAVGGRERFGEQLLIVAPPRCVAPGERRAFGFVANLYTLRSDHDWGVGDCSSLDALVAWAGEAGASFVGLNPMHALLNRGGSISPYSPVSRLFRNPLYIDVESIPELQLAPDLAARMDHPELRTELAVLREDARVRYEQVMSLKTPVLERLHQVFVERELPLNGARARAYQAYVGATDPELTRFATWMALGETNGWDWYDWAPELRTPESEAVARFQREHARRVDYHRWVQFELDRQLGAVAEHARRAGLSIGLYQDLAIGTSPIGADTWSHPRLFAEGASIGAPPDPYAVNGQNWGLPPIDPRALRRNRYQYFVHMLRSAFRHAGALRIDHVMGLFRLFWIPEGHSGHEGAYVRYPTADLLGILALESERQRALVVGEDLGTVPKEVGPALEKWGVLSSKVLYFERQPRGGFKPAERYPRLALTTANTHDLPTITGFWRGHDIELRARAGLLAGDEAAERARTERRRERRALLARLAREGVLARARDPGDPGLRRAVHEFLCLTPSVLVGFSLDDLAGETEPVNLPGVGADRYPSWTRKMSFTIEQMRASDEIRGAMSCSSRTTSASAPPADA